MVFNLIGAELSQCLQERYNIWCWFEFFCVYWHQRKNILILGQCPTQGIDDAILTAGKKYLINFTENSKKNCLSLLYNGGNSYYGVKIIKLKANDSEIWTPLCLGNVSKSFSVDTMNKAGLNGYVYDFNLDYDAIAVDDTLDIHKYFMKKHNIK